MSGNPTVLGFDTSSSHCGAAVFVGDDVVAAAYEDMKKGQAERLFPMLEEVMADAGLGWPDLDALGVGIGPGNFTGIRISVSAARGLALSLAIPAVGVSLFDALAEEAALPALLTLAAPRDEFYVQLRNVDDLGPMEVRAFDALPACPVDTTCVGVRSKEVAEALGLAFAPAAHAPASAIARIAARRYLDNPPRPAPLYLRPADATPSSTPQPRILP